MSEQCASCLHKDTGIPIDKMVISKEDDLCEFCGKIKPVVIKIKGGK